MGSRQKETVVILAEDNYMGRRLIDPGSFPQQAEWWAKDNEDVFNTVIIPYYNDWEGNELSDAKEIIDNIPGNVTIGIMGHSGTKMGGYPISDIGNKRTQSWRMEQMKDAALELLDIEENTYGLNTVEGYSKEEYENDTRENFKFYYQRYNKAKHSQTISGFVKSLKGHKDGKVKEVMVGACRMADREDLSILAEEIGIPVSGQSNTAWGTEAIAKTGDKPNQRFFVKGKTSVGVQFTPDRDFNLLETVSDTNNEKYRDTKRWMEDNTKPFMSLDTGSGWELVKPTQTWAYDERRYEITDKIISSDIETIKESIDLTQFESSFRGESDYKEFLSDLGEKGPVIPSKTKEESLESILMGDFLSEEESPIPFRNKPRADDETYEALNLFFPEGSLDEPAAQQEFSQSLDDISVRDFGGAGDSIQQSLMNLINPEETDLFEADTP